MTARENTPVSRAESEEQQDEEAKQWFADESPTGAPSSHAAGGDPDDGPEQPNDEA